MLFLCGRNKKSLLLDSFILVGSSALVCLSGSRAAMLAFFCLVIVGVFYLHAFSNRLRKQVLILFFTGIVLMQGFVFFVNSTPKIPQIHSLLSNRSVFWPLLVKKAQLKPWIGDGWYGFWG